MRKMMLLCIMMLGSVVSVSSTGSFEEGIEHYKNGKYDEALLVFSDLEKNNKITSGLLYNIGNCYFRKGKLGYAILYYERAKTIAPNDEDVKQNLVFANSLIKEKINEIPLIAPLEFWVNLSSLLTMRQWVYAAALVIYPLIFFLIMRLFFGRKTVWNSIFISCCVVMILFFASLSYTRYSWMDAHENGIVVEKTVDVLSSPDQTGNTVLKTVEGVKVRVDDRVGEWVKVRLSDGRQGWLAKEKIAVI